MSGTNSARQSGRFEIYPEGRVVLWTQTGPVACFTPQEAGRLMFAVAQGAPFHLPTRNAVSEAELKFETAAEFFARGGELTLGNAKLPSAQKRRFDGKLSLEDLGL